MITLPTYRLVTRRDFVRTGAAVGAFSVVSGFDRMIAVQPTDGLAEAPATHNMLAVGKSNLFLSHLPMFNKVNPQKTDYSTPHRFQVILQANLRAATPDPQKTYFEDRRSHLDVRMYTLQPKPFVLADLFPSAAGATALRTFPAQGVFRGHLERDGHVQILTDIDVDVVRVAYARKFVVSEPKAEKLEYILFGKDDELFAAHVITAPPDFDQVLPVRIAGRAFTAKDMDAGVRLSFPDRKNIATARLNAPARASGVVTIGGVADASFEVEAMKELYFEEGELFIPLQFAQTPEEKRAGFTEEG